MTQKSALPRISIPQSPTPRLPTSSRNSAIAAAPFVTRSLLLREPRGPGARHDRTGDGRERARARARERRDSRQATGRWKYELYDWLKPDEAHGLADGGLAGWPALHVASRDAGPPRSRPRRDGWRRGATEAWARWGSPQTSRRDGTPAQSACRHACARPVHAPQATKRARCAAVLSPQLPHPARSVRGAGVGAKSK